MYTNAKVLQQRLLDSVKLDKQKPLRPYVRVFYNTRLSQAIPIEEINLAESKYKDQIDSCIRLEDFNIDLLKFFKTAFID